MSNIDKTIEKAASISRGSSVKANIFNGGDSGKAEQNSDVVILDKNSVLSTVLAAHLSEKIGMNCVGLQVGDEDVVQIVSRRKPKILMVDPFDLPLTPTNDLQDFGRKVLIVSPKTRLFGYTQRLDENVLRGVIGANFAGCVGKQSDIRQLEIGLMAVQSGGVYFDPEYSALLKDAINGGASNAPNSLSRRERSVIIMTAKGQPAKQIANELKISPKTVETYKSRALSKLGLSNREELVDHAISSGWLT